eukprot:MONOS_7880.1-p1 / transcript=MONOS_7880.1 / gene=MONOS_7880 / organism=Monocercomonoides_exilis_PA203 / gene_product=unspecified product / transcript_product=unspecified product / location=Mono_scaffold00281:52978-54063(-) / protein_length=343 / sequence_SO=supercontig / SO=protein_coding / is_pseudo=false
MPKRHLKYIVSKLNKIDPDIVVITGDLFDAPSLLKTRTHDYERKEHSRSHDLDPLSDLHPPLGVFYVVGNHEHSLGIQEVLTTISAFPNIRVLMNEEVYIPFPDHSNRQKNSKTIPTDISDPSTCSQLNTEEKMQPEEQEYIRIVGIDDGSPSQFIRSCKYIKQNEAQNEGNKHPHEAYYQALPKPSSSSSSSSLPSASSSSSCPSLSILLHHRPHRDILPSTAAFLGVDVILCGHTHAGPTIFQHLRNKIDFHGGYGFFSLENKKPKKANKKRQNDSQIIEEGSIYSNIHAYSDTSSGTVLKSGKPFLYINPGTGTGNGPFRQISCDTIAVFHFVGDEKECA